MKIVFVTATRADFGKLKPVILALQERMDVHVFITGMHMLQKYGSTYREVLRAGVRQPYLFSNQRAGDPMDYVLARTLQGLGDYLKENDIDVVVVHGDRVEAMAGALAGSLHNVQVAHIEGGEVSGTVDEHLRHAITKLAHLHFVANEEARRRVLQLGERPEAVHVTGSPDLDVMTRPDLPTLDEARERYGIEADEYGVCIFHPVTTEVASAGPDAAELMAALEASGKDWVVIHPNNDHGAEAIMDVYRRYAGHERFRFFPSIRFEFFLTLLRHCSLMVGNSSAGIREAPFYGRYAVDVGTRQANRSASPLVIHVQPDRREIEASIAAHWGRAGEPSHEFGDGRSTDRIVEIFLSLDGQSHTIQKVFRDIADGTAESRADMNEIQQGLKDMQLRLVSIQLEQQFERNLALFQEVMPEAFSMLSNHQPEGVQLRYDDQGGYVTLADARDGSPVYSGDPREVSRGQVADFRARPRSLTAGNKRTATLAEESNAHLRNSNAIVDLLREEPQEAIAPLPERVDFLLMLGLGMGYQLEELLASADVRHLCLVEPRVDMFRASCHAIDWQPILAHFARPGYSLELVVGRDRDGFQADVSAYLQDIGPHQAVVSFVFQHLPSPELDAMLDDFTGRVMPQLVSALGYFDDEQVGLAHTVANFQEPRPVLQSHVQAGGPVQDVPAFVVANGPSLDEAVDFLRERGGAGVIFSCGTAIGSLRKAGVRPDIHVEMERSRPVVEWITTGTRPEDREGVALVALNTVHPEVFDLFERSAVVMKPNDAGLLLLSRYLGDESRVIALADCNPTVGNMGVALAHALGFRDIYLFGMDLGFAADGQHHSSLSAHYDVKDDARASLHLYRHDSPDNQIVEGNFGGQVVTTGVYQGARRNLERLLARDPAVRCWNTSRGVRIGGATPLPVAEIDVAGGAIDKRAVVDRVLRASFSTRGVRAIPADGARAVFDNTRDALDRFAALAATPVTTVEGGMEVLDAMYALIRELVYHPDGGYAGALLKGSMAMFCLLLSQALHRGPDEARCVGLYRRAAGHVVDFCAAAREKVDRDLLALDTRTRDLESKLAG